jgi:hypothetical protein
VAKKKKSVSAFGEWGSAPADAEVLTWVGYEVRCAKEGVDLYDKDGGRIVFDGDDDEGDGEAGGEGEFLGGKSSVSSIANS